MQIRNLFEALGKEAAIIFGRFNPAHKGHRAAWEQAKKSPIWYVGTNRTTVGPKDPLPFDVKIEVMKTIMPEIEGHILAETNWFTMASAVYEKHGDSITLYVVTDKTDKDWIMPTMLRQNGQQGEHGYYNFKNIEWREAPRLSSATDLRGAVMSGDRDAFSLAAGVSAETQVMGKPFFDLVAEYLLPEQEKEQSRVAAIAAKKAGAAAKKADAEAKRAAKAGSKTTAESIDVDEASLSTMRDYFAGDKNASDASKISQMRQHFSKASDAAKPTTRKEFRSEWEYQQWLKKNKLKQAEPSMAEDVDPFRNMLMALRQTAGRYIDTKGQAGGQNFALDINQRLTQLERTGNLRAKEIVNTVRGMIGDAQKSAAATRGVSFGTLANMLMKLTQQELQKVDQLNMQGVAEGSEIKIPTEDGITMQDIRLMAGEGPLTKKTVLQAIAVIRKQRSKQDVAEGDVVQFPQKHPWYAAKTCPKCEGSLVGGKTADGRVKYCMGCGAVYPEPNTNKGVAEGSDGWIGNPAKWKEAVLQAHGPDVVFKNYSHPGQPGKRSVNAINAAGKQVGVYQRHNKMGMVQPNMQGVAENFADGKNPQDKGDSARHGIPKKASVSSLRKIAKQGGRKGQLAHWQANMRSGKAKSEDVSEGDAVKHMAKDLTNPPKVMQHRAKRDIERDQQLKGRDIAKKDRTSKDEWGNLKRESFEEARMSAAARLGKAWDDQKAKSDASRQRAKDLLNPPKPEPKKTNETAGVGIITKQNTTVDVNKGTPRKNLKAFRLVK